MHQPAGRAVMASSSAGAFTSGGDHHSTFHANGMQEFNESSYVMPEKRPEHGWGEKAMHGAGIPRT